MTLEAPSYHDLAGWYDALYEARGKDYGAEAAALLDLAQAEGCTVGSVLDVACGTGRHLAAFAEHVDDVAGLDGSAEMLTIAASRLDRSVPLVEADFRTFDLGRTFDVVTCLFSSIGHVENPDELDAAVASMARHVGPGGVLLLEPWLTPDRVRPGGSRDLVSAETEEGLVVRVASSRREGDVVALDFAWAVATPTGVVTAEEHHRMPVFSEDRYLAAVTDAGLQARWLDDVPGFSADRGLVVGRRPS